MVRYDKIFSIIDIKEENMKKWGEVLPFYKNVQKEGVILWCSLRHPAVAILF